MLAIAISISATLAKAKWNDKNRHMKIKIINEKGLHARASAKLAELCERYDAEASVSYDGILANGKSIMGLMMLGAGHGSEVDVQTQGAQSEALLAAISDLFGDYFGEGR